MSWFVALQSALSLEYEGPSLWAAIQLAHGLNIYDVERLTMAPWAVTIYPPLYFIMGAPFQWIGGYFNYPGLRLISIGSFVGALIFFYRLLALYSTSRLNIAVGMVIFASFVPIWSGSFKARVDMLALSLSIAALYFAARLLREPSGTPAGVKQWLPAIFFTVLAIYAKVSSIVVLPAVCLMLLFKKRFREIVIYGGVSVAVCAIVFFIINIMTGGGFAKNLTFAFNARFSFDLLKKHLDLLGVDWPKLFMLPVIGLVWLEKTEPRERVILPFLIAVMSGLLSAYTIGTMHANLNHGMLFYFSLSWLLVIFLEIYPLSVGAGMVLASALCTYILSTQIPTTFTTSARMLRSVGELNNLQLKDKVIFTEDPSLAIACGAEPLFVDVATFLQVWDRDGHSLSDIEQALAEKRYPAVIININDSLHDKPNFFWSDPILDKIEENYKKMDYVIGNGERHQVYIPR